MVWSSTRPRTSLAGGPPYELLRRRPAELAERGEQRLAVGVLLELRLGGGRQPGGLADLLDVDLAGRAGREVLLELGPDIRRQRALQVVGDDLHHLAAGDAAGDDRKRHADPPFVAARERAARRVPAGACERAARVMRRPQGSPRAGCAPSTGRGAGARAGCPA